MLCSSPNSHPHPVEEAGLFTAAKQAFFCRRRGLVNDRGFDLVANLWMLNLSFDSRDMVILIANLGASEAHPQAVVVLNKYNL